jgi:hypothetical protein
MCTDPDMLMFIFVDVRDLITAHAVVLIVVHKTGKDARFLIKPVNAAFKSANPYITPAILQDVYYTVIAEAVLIGAVVPVVGENAGFGIVFIYSIAIGANPHVFICILKNGAYIITAEAIGNGRFML